MSMDAVEFINARDRMIKETRSAPTVGYPHAKPAEEIVAIVEKWAREHPAKTRQSVFLKQWPKAQLDKDGNIKICPKLIMGVTPSNNGRDCVCSCYDCRKTFWSQEVEA